MAAKNKIEDTPVTRREMINYIGPIFEELKEDNRKLSQRLESRMDKNDERIDKIDGRMDKIDGRMDKIDGRIDKIDGRLDKIDGRLDKIDGRLDKIDGRMDSFDNRFHRLEVIMESDKREIIGALETFFAVSAKSEVVENHGKRISILETEMTAVKSTLVSSK